MLKKIVIYISCVEINIYAESFQDWVDAIQTDSLKLIVLDVVQMSEMVFKNISYT